MFAIQLPIILFISFENVTFPKKINYLLQEYDFSFEIMKFS